MVDVRQSGSGSVDPDEAWADRPRSVDVVTLVTALLVGTKKPGMESGEGGTSFRVRSEYRCNLHLTHLRVRMCSQGPAMQP
jgi:hypothetical protein